MRPSLPRMLMPSDAAAAAATTTAAAVAAVAASLVSPGAKGCLVCVGEGASDVSGYS